MPAPVLPTLPAAPSRADDPSNFATKADAFLGALPNFGTQANALGVYMDQSVAAADADAAVAAASVSQAQAFAQAAQAGANVSVWASGTTYAVGAVVYSPLDFQSYRRRVAGAGTTDPSLDGTNWQRFSNGIKGYLVRTSAYTAVNEDQIIANTSSAAFTITLPASPASGAEILIADGANTWGTNNLTIARNGQTIGGLAEDMVCDVSGVTIRLVFNGSTWRVYAQLGANNGTAVAGPASSTDNGLVAFSGTNGRVLRGGIAAGTTGQVLTSQGAGQLPVFANAPASMIDLIETRTISSAAQIDFINLSSTYYYYMIIANNITASAAGDLWLRTSTDNGGTFAAAAGNYAYNYGLVQTGYSVTRTTAAQGIIGNISTSTNTASIQLTLYNMGLATGFPQFLSMMFDFSTTVFNRTESSGIRAANGAVNAVRILPASGTITGTFKLYGVKA